MMVTTGLLCFFAVQFYLGIQPDILFALIWGSLIFGIYTLNQYTDNREDFANDPARFNFFKNNNYLFYGGIIALVIPISVLLFMEKLSYQYLLLIAIGISYSFHILPWVDKEGRVLFFRLKEVPLLKNFVVALAWGLSIFALPLSFSANHAPITFTVYALCTCCIIFAMNNTVFGDIKDIKGDRVANNRTGPVRIGVKKCFSLIAIMDVIWLFCLFFFNNIGWINNTHFVFLLMMCLYPAVYLIPYSLKQKNNNIIALLSKSDVLMFSAGLLVLTGL